MRISRLEFFPVSVPYTHRECSSQVDRDGVSDVIVKATADNGLTGWGESCSGADIASVVEALRAMSPFVVGRDPWESEWIRANLWHTGLWNFRKATASFAYAGIDMALWDLCGKACGQPLYNLLGGRVRDHATYFYYLSWGDEADLEAQCLEGIACGYQVFYLKVGKDQAAELRMAGVVRRTIGPDRKLRLDANGSWSVAEALRHLDALAVHDIDFIEQPVAPDPLSNMREARTRCRMAVCANEGLWTAEDAYRHITGRTADVYCFSPYWVGSLQEFQRLSRVAAAEGLHVCKHTHGELGISAAACHHVLLTLPNIVEGNQQTAQMMRDDVLVNRLPIAEGPHWGTPDGHGLGIEIDEEKLARYHAQFLERGQYLPYDKAALCREGRS
jgi:L-alanine-DL-glutamate epimerase-like enolase superfamily enzyme